MMTIRERAIQDVKADMDNWITEGTAIKGWYTCEKTGKKFRGKDAQAQLDKQGAEIAFMITMIEDTEMENEMDAELDEEVQHAVKMALVNAGMLTRQEKEQATIKPREDILEMTDELVQHLEEQAEKGKQIALVTIECVDCGGKRHIKPQDRFQVKRCEECQKKHRNAMRAQRRREKKAAEKKDK